MRAAEDSVSRNHASVTFENGQWILRDLNSANGIIVGGQRVEFAPVNPKLTARLGADGPFISLELADPAAAGAAPPATPPTSQTSRPQMPMPGVITPDRPATQSAPKPSASATDPAIPTGQQPRATMSTKVAMPAGNAQKPADAFTSADAADRYFGKLKEGEVVGERTMMIRQAFQQVQKKQRWKHRTVVGILLAVVCGIGGFAYLLQQQSSKQRQMAEEMFYTMKTLDVDIANLQKMVIESGTSQNADQVRRYRERRQELQKNYEQYLNSLKVYNSKMPEKERLVLRVARIFGECELKIPEGFQEEVQNYIGKWQGSSRYANAVMTAREKGYTKRISDEMISQGVPPQFFYLGLQESNFDATISGPETYMGIAKGMWQFIPPTGLKYGLRIGPLADMRRPDPEDDRHNWERATNAAARYLSDLYTKEAMGSGLLVMASYNWGEHKVKRLINSLPANTRERNFWVLLEKYKDDIPKETYDYVFYIFSAAVIGENPRLFGFDFDNPLAHLEQGP